MMKSTYQIEAQAEHYGLMVDIYAIAFLNSMPVKPHVGEWDALLQSCGLHGNKHLTELASMKITDSDSIHDARRT